MFLKLGVFLKALIIKSTMRGILWLRLILRSITLSFLYRFQLSLLSLYVTCDTFSKMLMKNKFRMIAVLCIAPFT